MRRLSSSRAASDRGFSLVELLFSLLVLTMVITTSLAVFYDRQKRIAAAGEMSFAWQALANEAEARRHQPFASLLPGAEEGFVTDLAIVASLEGATARVAIEEESPTRRKLTLSIDWSGDRSASIIVYRTDTGGGPLW